LLFDVLSDDTPCPSVVRSFADMQLTLAADNLQYNAVEKPSMEDEL